MIPHDPPIGSHDPPIGAPTLGAGMVGAITYVLKNEQGDELDRQEEAILYLHGAGALVPGLEAALEGRHQGDHVEAQLTPAEAFGEYDPELVYYVARDQIPAEAPLEPLAMFSATREGVEVTFWITQVEDDRVVVNENHPLAGQGLTFEVDVVGVRAATEQEQREQRIET